MLGMPSSMPKYIPIIGLEIHAELKTKSKMFCSCFNNPDRDPANTNICEICLAHPGTLPVPNKTAIEWTVLIAKVLNCSINKTSKFDRKHYFYPDLPKGYQISQYDLPIGEGGFLQLDMRTTDNLRAAPRIGVTRVHLEEDTAKLTHAVSHPEDDKTESFVDFNRAGVPLVEIVSDPDIQSAAEAKLYCQELQMVLRYLGVSDADMEKGHMRCEANISVQEEGKFKIENKQVKAVGGYKLNPKVELKNINSFRAIEKSIEYEIKRQTAILKETSEAKSLTNERSEFGDGVLTQQTRGWDDDKGESYLQREKETSADYRYFPEPDIPPFEPEKISGKIELPELPAARRLRFHEDYGFSYADAQLLTADKYWGDFAENTMSELYGWLKTLPESKQMAKEMFESKKKELARLTGGWLTSKLAGAMAERKIDIRILKIKPENFAELIALIHNNRVNSTNGQKILIEMIDSGVDKDPTRIMEEKNYGQVNDENKISAIVDKVISDYPKQAAEFKSGKEPIIKFLLGMVMRASEGAADPMMAEKLLRKKLTN